MKEVKDIFKYSNKISLTQDEKEGIKRTLQAYVDMNPVRVGLSERIKYQRSKTKIKFKLMPLILALLLTFSGGTALAANSALPGDLLYPVKIGINEKIRGVLAFTSEAEAGYQGDLAVRRIEEIEQLIAEGKLEVTLKEKIEENFEKHSENTLNLIEELEAKGNFEAAAAVGARFEASLKAHDELIARISDNSEFIRARLESTLERLNSRLDVAARARIDAEARLESGESESKNRVEATIEAKVQQSERAIDSAKNDFDQYESKLSDRIKTEVRSRIKSAEESHAQGLIDLGNKDFVAAFIDFQSSLSLTHQAKVMIKSWMSFEVRFNKDDNASDRDDLEDRDDSEDEDEDKDESDDGDKSDDDDEKDESDDRDSDDEDDESDVKIEGDVDLNVNGLNGRVNSRVGIG